MHVDNVDLHAVAGSIAFCMAALVEALQPPVYTLVTCMRLLMC